MKIQINGPSLERLRTNRNIPLTSVATRSGIDQARLQILETEGGEVLLSEAQKLASIFKLSWYVFLDDELEAPRNFGNDNRSNKHKREELIDVSTQKVMEDVRYLLEVIHELEPESSFKLPKLSSTSPEAVAVELRKYLGIKTDDLAKLSDDYAVWRYWKDKFSSLGLYVFERSWEVHSIRAFSMSYNNKAAAVLSTKDMPTARIFSLMHEVCHLVNKESAICDLHFNGSNDTEVQCNRFAAAFLMPAEEFEEAATSLGFIKHGQNVVTEENVKSLQKLFRVSRLSVYRRLLTLGFIGENNYKEIQKSYGEFEYLKKSKGGSKDTYFRSRLNGVGQRYASQVITAHANGRLTTLALAGILNVRVSQLSAITSMVGGNGRSG